MNKYETIETIGQGQYGVVLKAINKETSQLVAIKKFKEDDSQPENKKVILREVKILKTLNHENIIELKQAFRKKGKIYLVCQYVEKNLLQIIQENSLTAPKVKYLTYQMLKGIAYMHNLNIIHRDIKPENLLISKHDQVKICDLGFARVMPSNGKMTDYVATRWYRAPELLIGKEDYDSSIDIWSIGCVMAEMIDGEPLFGGENDLDQLYLIQKCLGPLISDHKQYFLKNPKFVGMKFPEIHAIESVDRRYFGKIDKLGLDLLKKMLKMDPQQRVSAQQALKHQYFASIVTIQAIHEKQQKKSGIKDSRHHIKQEKIDINKSQMNFNNFLQDKNCKRENNKIVMNKVNKLQKINSNTSNNNNTNNTNSNNNNNNNNINIEQVTSPWIFTGKGKSLGKKPNGATMRDREFLYDKIGKTKMMKEAKNQNDDEYYADDWDEFQQNDEQKKSHLFEKSDRKNQQKSLGKKKKMFKKDSVNIVFNQNAYNVNIVQEHKGY